MNLFFLHGTMLGLVLAALLLLAASATRGQIYLTRNHHNAVTLDGQRRLDVLCPYAEHVDLTNDDDDDIKTINNAALPPLYEANKRVRLHMHFENDTHGTFYDSTGDGGKGIGTNESDVRDNYHVKRVIYHDNGSVEFQFDESLHDINMEPISINLMNNVDCEFACVADKIDWGTWLAPPWGVPAHDSRIFTIGGSLTTISYHGSAEYQYDNRNSECYLDSRMEFHISPLGVLVHFTDKTTFFEKYHVRIADNSEPLHRELMVNVYTRHVKKAHVFVGSSPKALYDATSNSSNIVGWRKSADEMVALLNEEHAFQQFHYGFIGGDLTEDGKKYRLDDFHMKYVESVHDVRLMIGLGRNDYHANAGRCWSHGWRTHNGCAITMVMYINDLLMNYAKLLPDFAADWRRESSPTSSTDLIYRGSMAYGFTFNGYRFYQLHFYPTYHNTLIDVSDRFYIESSLHWLHNDMSKYKESGEKIIILMNDLEFDRKDITEFFDMLDEFPVMGVFGSSERFSSEQYKYRIPTFTSPPMYDVSAGGYFDLSLDPRCMVVKSMGVNRSIRGKHTIHVCMEASGKLSVKDAQSAPRDEL